MSIFIPHKSRRSIQAARDCAIFFALSYAPDDNKRDANYVADALGISVAAVNAGYSRYCELRKAEQCIRRHRSLLTFRASVPELDRVAEQNYYRRIREFADKPHRTLAHYGLPIIEMSKEDVAARNAAVANVRAATNATYKSIGSAIGRSKEQVRAILVRAERLGIPRDLNHQKAAEYTQMIAAHIAKEKAGAE